MTEISREILDKYQIRKTGPQKSAFIDYMKEKYPHLRVESGGFPRSRNLVVGDPDRAKVIFCAHYDTCAALPFPNLIMPKNIPLSLLYAVLICIPFLALGGAAAALVSLLTESAAVQYWTFLGVYFVSFFALLLFGRPNRHTVNDNTSGVIVLCELMETLPPSVREQVAFVFFDHEENGLIGSSYFRKMHKKTTAHTPVINFDCVSDGEHMLLVQSKPFLKQYGDTLRTAFPDGDGIIVHHEKSSTTFYPSDQGNFPVSVGVTAMKRGRCGLYLDRIHTARDTVMRAENIDYLIAAAAKFLAVCEIQ